MDDNSSPIQQIHHLAREKLEVFKASIRADGTYKDSIYKGVQSASQQIASDYGSRFLIELIQNAYDAHPPDRNDGEIKVLLVKEEDENGTFYIANKGNGFSWGDVESLCNIGTSNKPVGESIGNKGFGFRSVRYITDDPQIYSKSENGFTESYDGYCFRFARGDDFDELLTDQHHRELAKKDIPFFHIPIPLTDQPPIIHKFAREGYSTVIRLPLRNEFACQLVIKLLEKIRTQNVPLILFLRRINTLEMVVHRDPEKSFYLLRESKPLIFKLPGHSEDEYSCVILENGEKYFIAWHMIPEVKVKNAIDESIKLGQLHQSWEDWKGDGELAVAVKSNGDVISPILYTFLPMGDQVECPFHGYLHGSFYPKSDRTNLDASIPVNSLYIDETARLCVRTILALRQAKRIKEGNLSHEERGTAIIDLLAWSPSSSIDRDEVSAGPVFMREAFIEAGSNFSDLDILPTVPRRGSNNWGTAKEVWRWDQPHLKIFSADSLVKRVNAAILSLKLGQDRLDRLERFIGYGNDNLTVSPTDLQLSHIAEMIAIQVVTSQSSKRAKMDYYLELEKVFRDKSIDLSERKILYCTDGILRASISKEIEDISQDITVDKNLNAGGKRRKGRRRVRWNTTTVFSPSRRSIDEAKDLKDEPQILQVPKELEKSLAFLTDELDWYEDLKEVRIFFEERRLVQSYDADDLIAQVSTLSRSARKKCTRQATLSWVFNLWLSYQKVQRSLSLRSVNLLVPTLRGRWIEANQAIFSAGWPAKTFGNVTEEFLSQTSSYADELQRRGERLLAHKNVKPFSSKTVEDWSDFLEAIGVKKGLQPLQIEDKGFEMTGWNLNNAEDVCRRLQRNEATQHHWQKDIEEYGERPIYQSSSYELDGSFWYFPGQEQYSNFPEDARYRYAQLILLWLEAADSEHFKVVFFSQSARHASRFSWPTPLAAFLRQAPWFPVEVQDGLNSQRRFLKPSEVWVPNDDDNDYLPPYMPNIPKALRRQISVDSTRRHLVESCKVNIFNDPASLPKQVWFLGKLFAEASVDSYHLKSFLNLYNDTWLKLASSEVTTEKLINTDQRHLITKQNNQYTFVTVSASDSPITDMTMENQVAEEEEIYVRDTEDNFGIELAAKQGFHIFDSGPQGAVEIAKLLRDLLRGRFRAVSEIQITLLVDGEECIPSESEGDFAVNVCPWLPYIVYLSMESFSGTVAQHLPANRSIVISRVNNIRFRHARSVQYKVGDTVIPLTNNGYGAVAFSDIHKPLLIIQSDAENLDWAALAHASSQFSQLIKQVDLSLAIRHCFMILEQLQEPISGPITDLSRGIDALCNEFGIDRRHAEKALEGLSNDVMRLGRLIRPIIHYFGGMEASEQFDIQAEQVKTLPDLIEILRPYLEGTKFVAEVVVNVCQRATGFSFIRDDLGFSFGDFNRSLVAIGEDPDLHVDSHIAAVRSYIAENKDAIMACIRSGYYGRFNSRQSLKEYVRYREEIEALQPKQEWLMDIQIPEKHMIEELVNEWLVEKGAPILTANKNLLPMWSKIRIDNKSRINKLVQSYSDTVKAWCFKQGIEPPKEWNGTAVPEDLCNILNELGALDFKRLEETDLISWLIIANVWPKGMPPTIVLKELGLNKKDLEDEINRERAEKIQREKEARSLTFNGRRIDPQEINPEVLAKEIHDNLSKSLTTIPLGRTTRLHVMPEKEKRRGTSTRRGGGGGRRGISSEKTDLIGYLGECAVYYWLKRVLPQQDIDSAWASGYRSRLLLGVGDDSLGYDFKVPYRRQTWYLEVKASLDDPEEFELGDTEIRMARDCASAKAGEYRIVFVSNVQETMNMHLDVLPNPLSEEGKPFFRIGGQGIRYQFSTVSKS